MTEIDGVARELAARILAGDREAEIELFRRYGPGVMRMLQAITRNRWSAEDVHQETFAIVLRRLRRRPLEDPAALPHFVRQTARRLVMVANRKTRRGLETALETIVDDLVDPRPGQLMRVLMAEQRELVREAVDRVQPDRYRQLLVRYYIDEEEKESICAEMGLTAVHFNRVLFRARQHFAQMVSRHAKKNSLMHVRWHGPRRQ
jgi:RNA polymerase sigma-70 factor (ECF subfamily)